MPMIITLLWLLIGLFSIRFIARCLVFSPQYLSFPLNQCFYLLDRLLDPFTTLIHLLSITLTGQKVPTTPIRQLIAYCETIGTSCDSIESALPGHIEWVYFLAIFMTIGVVSIWPKLSRIFLESITRTRNWMAQSFQNTQPSRLERATTLPQKDAFSERMLKEALRDEVWNAHRDVVRDYEQTNKRLENRANTDKLTGLTNRRGLSQKAITEWYNAQRGGLGFNVALFDLDDFKHTNDTFGHHAGDDVLKWVAQQLKYYFPYPHITFRLGGEELGIMIIGLDPQAAFQKTDQCRLAISQYQSAQYPGLTATTSIGLVSIPSQIMPSMYFDEDKLLSQADELLYQAKQQGKNRIVQTVLS